MNSFNHYAYGAIGDWLYRSVAGIDTSEAEPGYKKIILRPRPGAGLEWAEGRLETMYGTIVSRWSRTEEGRMEVRATVPANTSAEIVLPGAASTAAVMESGRPLAEAEGLSFAEETPDGVKLTAAAGEYAFAYSLG
ncbi:alpha-L-rhamnosidase C-terminal domain-containing protein [Cohnella fermenti]|uniref:alpha-L-rhamnosidase C-terminal domain-containing protein n=1 Tax=Cohnella fermenti TaxID=2565925 RepID=UPI001E5F23F6|nr:alpha-L-rhamnosidase C-terminal domain-containing protein [Cohnella fermenti]